jgi:hypothetical protein
LLSALLNGQLPALQQLLLEYHDNCFSRGPYLISFNPLKLTGNAGIQITGYHGTQMLRRLQSLCRDGSNNTQQLAGKSHCAVYRICGRCKVGTMTPKPIALHGMQCFSTSVRIYEDTNPLLLIKYCISTSVRIRGKLAALKYTGQQGELNLAHLYM